MNDKTPVGDVKPVWSEWVKGGRLPKLPDGWEWSDSLPFFAESPYRAVWLGGRVYSHSKRRGHAVEGVNLSVVIALVEARALWVAAGGVL